MDTALIGKAGVGLATFHLARLGHEVTPTSINSASGDLLVNFGGVIEAVEVKATMGRSWNLRRGQVQNVKRVVLVDVLDACAWMIRSDALLPLFGRRAEIAVPDMRADGLAEIVFHKMMRCAPVSARKRRKGSGEKAQPGARGNRVVVRKLKDGTLKRYEYPPYKKPTTYKRTDFSVQKQEVV